MERKTCNYEILESNIETINEALTLAECITQPRLAVDRAMNLLVVFMKMYTEDAGELKELSSDARNCPGVVRSLVDTIFQAIYVAQEMLQECHDYKVSETSQEVQA